MYHKIINFLKFLKASAGIYQFNNVHSNYHGQAKVIIEEITAAIELSSHPSFPPNGLLKMQWYMAEFLYTCESLNQLKGIKSTSEQRRSYLLSGALGVMCDLIIDDIDFDTVKIKTLKRPKINPAETEPILLLYYNCYHTFFSSLEEPIREKVLYYYEKVFDAQLESKQQFDASLKKESAEAICRKKGGFSVLFLRAMIDQNLDTKEAEAWFEIGAFIQFCNDAQDLHKDLLKQIRTFATTQSDLKSIAKAIDTQKQVAFSMIKKLPYPQVRKDSFLFTLNIMCIGILSKLNAFNVLCKGNNQFNKLQHKPKKEVRSKLKSWKLIKYALPKILRYRYETVDKAYEFELINSFKFINR